MNFVKKIDSTYTFSRSHLAFAFSYVILFSSIVSRVMYSPLPYSSDPYSDEFLVKREGVKAAKEMFKLIPPNASISASNNLGIKKIAFTADSPDQIVNIKLINGF